MPFTNPNDLLATPTPQSQQAKTSEYAWHKEQERMSFDIIRIANPPVFTIKGKNFNYPHGDYYIIWDNYKHKVPINGTLDIQRYLARKYRKDMAVDLINYYGEIEGNKLRERIVKEQPNVAVDKYMENKSVWDKIPRTDDETLLAEIYPQLWLGEVKLFGLDDLPVNPAAAAVDFRTFEERFDSEYGNKQIMVDAISEPVVDKEPLLEEVTNNEVA